MTLSSGGTYFLLIFCPFQVRIITDWYKSVDEKDTTLSELFSSLSPNNYLEDKIKKRFSSESEYSWAAIAKGLVNIYKTCACDTFNKKHEIKRLINFLPHPLSFHLSEL